MNHITALLIKYTAIIAVLLTILGIAQNVSIPRILFISLVITGAAYLIGDLFILPRYGNMIATVADFGLIFLGVWGLAYFLTDIYSTRVITIFSFWSALIIGVIEVFFHIYMQKLVLLKDQEEMQKSSIISDDRYAMEISDEQLNYSEIKKGNSLETKKVQMINKKVVKGHFFIWLSLVGISSM